MEKRFSEILALRKEKAKEYTKDGAFDHFITASSFLNAFPEEVALFYATKHIVSLRDAVLYGIGVDKLSEKVNDIIIYALLIEALVLERNAK